MTQTPHRPWREIAEELICETDFAKKMALARELQAALDALKEYPAAGPQLVPPKTDPKPPRNGTP